jgi:hypothetical protein
MRDWAQQNEYLTYSKRRESESRPTWKKSDQPDDVIIGWAGKHVGYRTRSDDAKDDRPEGRYVHLHHRFAITPENSPITIYQSK